jgi:hypothetical protein
VRFGYFYSHFFLPWLGRLVAGLSKLCPGFDPRLVNVRFVVHKVVMGQVSLPILLFPLSVSFHQCSTLVFIYMLLLPEGRTGEAWEPSKSNVVTEIGEYWSENYFSLLYAVVRQAERCDRYGGTPSSPTTSKGPVLPSEVQFKHLCRGTDMNSRTLFIVALTETEV